MSARQRRHRERKRNGYVVKGITKRHWWDRYDRDMTANTRQRLKRDLRHHLKAWGMDA
jgi:hypothetical protein